MGIFLPEKPAGAAGPSYGRWYFDGAHVAKWNCVFRVQDPNGIHGDYRYRMFVPIGTVAEVEGMLRDWTAMGN